MPPSEEPIVWRPLVVCPNAALARDIEAALLGAGIAGAQAAGEYPQTAAFAGLAARRRANVCFVDVDSDQERALLLISEASASMPVVAVNPRKDGDLILRCLRRGACEFLSESAPEAVRGVFERLLRSRTPRSGRRPGTVYCVVPGKPGCGASTVAVHLALQMRAGGKVLLVDADPLTASVGFMLKLKSAFHLGDVVRDWNRMDEELWSRLTAPFAGIDVLLAPEAPIARLEIGRSLAGEFMAFWRERYDAVVVDAPDLRTAAESGLAAHADQVLLVTTNELAALHATRRAIEFLDLSAAERGRLRLVVNRYVPAAGLKREDLKTVLQVEPYAVLSNDYEMVQGALLDGKPVAPNSRFRSSLCALSEQLQGKTPCEPKRGSWRSRLGLGK